MWVALASSLFSAVSGSMKGDGGAAAAAAALEAEREQREIYMGAAGVVAVGIVAVLLMRRR
jgi:hypothetical protein